MKQIEFDDTGFVYLLHCVGTPYYKIGKTKNDPKDRARAIGRTNPLEIIELDFRYTGYMSSLEDYCHCQFHDKHHRYEWFVFDSPEEAIRLFNEKVNSFKQSKGKDEEDFEDNAIKKYYDTLNFIFGDKRKGE